MRPVVVGIAGGTASGKSTLAAALADALGSSALTIVHDRYYHSLPDALRHDPVAHNFDHPDALDTPRLVRDLESLRAGSPVELPFYDFACMRRLEGEETIEARPWVIVEGILVMADERLRACFDHRIFVETPDDLRLLRRIRRDIASRGRAVDEILAQYERTVRPMHLEFVSPSRAHAELVIDGTLEVEGNIARMLRHIGAR